MIHQTPTPIETAATRGRPHGKQGTPPFDPHSIDLTHFLQIDLQPLRFSFGGEPHLAISGWDPKNLKREMLHKRPLSLCQTRHATWKDFKTSHGQRPESPSLPMLPPRSKLTETCVSPYWRLVYFHPNAIKSPLNRKFRHVLNTLLPHWLQENKHLAMPPIPENSGPPFHRRNHSESVPSTTWAARSMSALARTGRPSERSRPPGEKGPENLAPAVVYPLSNMNHLKFRPGVDDFTYWMDFPLLDSSEGTMCAQLALEPTGELSLLGAHQCGTFLPNRPPRTTKLAVVGNDGPLVWALSTPHLFWKDLHVVALNCWQTAPRYCCRVVLPRKKC